MNEEKKNQLFLILIIIMMLIIVTVFITIDAVNDIKDRKNDDTGFKIKQIYSSDYDLISLNDKYYLGVYKEKINVVINEEGMEIFRPNLEIEYNSIYYKDQDEYYIIDYRDEIIEVYLFSDGEIKDYDVIKDYTYAKPILYRKDNKEILCGFVTYVGKTMKLYNVLTKESYSFDNISLLGDLYENDNYYINNIDYLVVKNNDNLVGVINFSGRQVIKFAYKDVMTTNDSFIVVDKKNRYGVIDSDSKKIKIDYKAIYYNNGYYLVVNRSNKMALYDKNYKNLTGFKFQYDNLKEYNLRSNSSIYMEMHSDRIFVVNNYLEAEQGTEYEYHNLYVVLEDGSYEKYDEYGINISDYVFLYDKKGNVKIYDLEMNLLSEIKIKDLKNISALEMVDKSVLRIGYYNNNGELKTEYLNTETYGLVSTKYDKLILLKNDFYGYIKKDDKYTFYIIHDGDRIYEVSGNDIRINGNHLIVDHEIYELSL